MKPDAFEKIGFGLGTEELYEIALDREIMRLRERVLRSHTELMLQGLQKLATSQTAEDGLLNILHALNQSESMDGSFVLVSSPDGSFRVFSSTIAECRETVWHPGPMFERLFSAGKPVILHDLGHSSEWRKQPALMGKYRSAVHAPFRFGTFRAAIVCVSARRGYINYMHAKLMFRLGPLLTQALILKRPSPSAQDGQGRAGRKIHPVGKCPERGHASGQNGLPHADSQPSLFFRCCRKGTAAGTPVQHSPVRHHAGYR